MTITKASYDGSNGTMATTRAGRPTFFEIPEMPRLSMLGKFGRHAIRRPDAYTLMVRDYRGTRRMSYTLEFRPCSVRGHKGFRVSWSDNYWDKGDYFFVPAAGRSTGLADVASYCDYEAERGRAVLRNAGLDDGQLGRLVEDVMATVKFV